MKSATSAKRTKVTLGERTETTEFFTGAGKAGRNGKKRRGKPDGAREENIAKLPCRGTGNEGGYKGKLAVPNSAKKEGKTGKPTGAKRCANLAWKKKRGGGRGGRF